MELCIFSRSPRGRPLTKDNAAPHRKHGDGWPSVAFLLLAAPWQAPHAVPPAALSADPYLQSGWLSCATLYARGSERGSAAGVEEQLTFGIYLQPPPIFLFFLFFCISPCRVFSRTLALSFISHSFWFLAAAYSRSSDSLVPFFSESSSCTLSPE